jgi:TolB-like protein
LALCQTLFSAFAEEAGREQRPAGGPSLRKSERRFSDGLTEETIMRFGKMSPHDMGVIARTSSMTYKHPDKSVLQIGRELGVDYVLEGRVRRADRVRVTAQLVRVCDQIHLWADNFDRPSQSILDIHSEVGAAIASQVKLGLTPAGKRQLRSLQTVDQQAYDLYLHGRYHWARLTHPEMQKAIEYFRKATERDPRFALAFSGFADFLVILPINSDVAPKDVFPEAKAAIAKALGNLWRHTIPTRPLSSGLTGILALPLLKDGALWTVVPGRLFCARRYVPFDLLLRFCNPTSTANNDRGSRF